MFADVPIGTGFVNTALVLAVKGAMTMLFCPLAGYAFAKYDFPGKNVLFGVVLLTLMLPTIVLIIPLLLEMKELGWVNTYQALILPGSRRRVRDLLDAPGHRRRPGRAARRRAGRRRERVRHLLADRPPGHPTRAWPGSPC